MNHDDHKLAPILNFQLMQGNPGTQLDGLVAEHPDQDAANDDIIMGNEQLFNHLNDVDEDEDMVNSPSDWTSIAEQYGPFQNILDMQGEDENNINGIEGSNGMPDYAYDYPEMPSSYPAHEDLDEQYY